MMAFTVFKTCVCGFVYFFPRMLRSKTKNKKHRSRGGKIVFKEGNEVQIIRTLLDGVCPLAQDPRRGWTFRMFTSKSRR